MTLVNDSLKYRYGLVWSCAVARLALTCFSPGFHPDFTFTSRPPCSELPNELHVSFLLFLLLFFFFINEVR